MFSGKPKQIQVLAAIFIAIVALLPFHALISTWAISNFGFELLFKSWKELLLFFVAVPICCWIIAKDKDIRNRVITSNINLLIALFAGLNVLMAVFADNGQKAIVAGLAFNLRFFAMFVVAQVLALSIKKKALSELLLRVVFFGGLVVVVFGAMQVLLLPHDFLRHFGYQKSIIPPYFTIDNNEAYVRILSTLRGPNALGAYLVFWLPLLALVTKRMWYVAVKYRVYAVLIWAASLITLFGSRSRSAWLGVVISLGIFILLSVNSLWQKRLLIGGVFGVALICALLAASWNTTFVQTTLRHRDPLESSNVDSDTQHQSSLANAIKHVVQHPLGTGTGSANLASTYGSKPNIVENYYLQIATELGILGLLVFMAILALVAKKLWQHRFDDITAALFASFIGLAAVNLLLPAWGDETVSMLWWGMAGIVLMTKISTKHNKSAKL